MRSIDATDALELAERYDVCTDEATCANKCLL